MPPSQASVRPSALITRYAGKRCTCVIASALLWSLASTANAEPPQEDESARWFQVELVVFTQPDAPLTDEYWSEQLQPNYDDNAILLLPGSAPASVKQPGMLDELPEQIEIQQSRPTATIEGEDPDAPITSRTTTPEHATLAALTARQMPELYHQLYPNTAATLPTSVSSNAPSAQPIDWPESLPEVYNNGAFALLSEAELNPPTTGEAKQEDEPELQPIDLKRLQKKGHRILFHGNWRQPMQERQQSRSIIIRGGHALDPQHFELEGDIKLSLNRFLHLWPQLYLTLPLPQQWQPRDPETIRALATAQLPILEAQTLSQATFSNHTFVADAVANAPLAPADSNRFQIDTETALIGNTPLFDNMAKFEAPLPDSSAITEPEIPPARYLTVKIDQPRRIRSGELHYLDHPLFGLLIRITPYSLPVIEQPALPVDQTGSLQAASVTAASVSTLSGATSTNATPAAQ